MREEFFAAASGGNEGRSHRFKNRRIQALKYIGHLGRLRKRTAHARQVAGIRAARTDAAHQAFHIENRSQRFLQFVKSDRIIDKFFDGFFTFLDAVHRNQRMAHPLLQVAPAHGSHRKVEHVAKRAADIVGIQRTHQFQVTQRTRIKRHVVVEIQNLERRKVRKFGLLLVHQVLEKRSRHLGFDHSPIQAKAIQSLDLKVRKQHILRGIFAEQECRKFCHQNVFGANQVHHSARNHGSFGHHDFFRHAAAEFTFKSLHRAPAGSQVAGRHVGNRKRDRVLFGNERAKVIRLFRIQVRFVHRSAGTDDFYNVALDDSLCKLRVFHLFANGDAVTRRHHLGHIAVCGMVREPAQRRCSRGAVVAARERKS